VLLAQEDPARGIVLGGIYVGGGPFDAGVDGQRVRRYTLRTPGGHRLTLDDQAPRLRIEDSAGSFVEMAADKLTLSSKTDIGIVAPGRRITIRGRAIDLEDA